MGKEIIVQLASPERKFVKTYLDFLQNELLSAEEKIVFIVLKSFVDFSKDNGSTQGEAYPTMETVCRLSSLSRPRATRTINKLIEKKIVKKIRRGLTKSNVYILSDFASMWACDSVEDMAAVAQNDGIKPMTPAEHIAELERMGYKVEIKERGLDTEPTKAQYQAPDNTIFPTDKNTTAEPKSQAERYSMEQMKQLYDYDVMIADNPYLQQDIDSVLEVIHTTVNTTKRTIRIAGESKPSEVVVSKLMKLTYSEIMYVIERYREQTERIKNPTSYLLTMLFNAKEQMNLDITNQVSHDMARWKTEE